MSEVEKLFEEFKGRLVEVECECDDEKRAKCVMYPEYCDGTRKEIIDLVQLIDEGLNNKLLSDRDTRIEELEQENVKLKKQIFRNECVRCIHTDSPCVPSDYGKDKDNCCDHFKSVFEENEELKTQIDKLKSCSNCKFSEFGYCKIRCKGDECNKKDKWELEEVKAEDFLKEIKE